MGGDPLAVVDPSGLDPCIPIPGYDISNCVDMVYGIGQAGNLSSIQFFDTLPAVGSSLGLSGLAGAISPFVALGLDIYTWSKGLGLWGGGSPFHGSVAASQSGKNVPSTGALNVPGPPAAKSDPWDGHYMLQAMFQSPEAGEFKAAYTTVQWASAYDAIAAAPVVLDSAGIAQIAVGTTERGGIHFAVEAEGTWMHGTTTFAGDGIEMTSQFARTWAQGAFRMPIPVLNSGAVLPEEGAAVSNCFTGVCSAILRGWLLP